MTVYYSEYPVGSFEAKDDETAKKNPAKIIYKESDTEDGTPFIMVKEFKLTDLSLLPDQKFMSLEEFKKRWIK